MIIEDSQQAAYNKAALKLAEAIEMLGNTVVQGHMPLVCLNDVYDHLHEAAEALLDIDYSKLGNQVRDQLRTLRDAEVAK